jgi:peptide/nickel transport system substrate-binding protein
MGPYFVKELLVDGHLLERNPYYYRVDTAGQQLPYIDYARGTYRSDNSSRVLAVIGGEVDFWVSHQASIEDFPVFKENEDKGGYNAFLLDSGKPANINIHINATYAPETEDPYLTELFQTKEFRQALSLAINRQEIVDVVFLGNAEPVQQTFNRSVSNFKEEWLWSYAEYDPDKANMLLDSIGLTARDNDGFRLRPDGSKLEILFEVPQQLAPNVAASELITKYWQDVGLRILLKVQDIGIVVDHLRNSTAQLSTFGNEWGGDIFYVMFGFATWNTWAGAHKYWEWSRDNSTGWEPPQIWKDIFAAENRRQQVPMEQVLEDATWILDWHAENVHTIGVAGYAKSPGIIKRNLINTNPDVHDIWEWDRINAHRPYQWFFKN